MDTSEKIVKQQIMRCAFDLFSQYGIKGVSMDDIARSMGISKRTIYDFFEDKETLLTEGLTSSHNHIFKLMEQYEHEKHSALDIILLLHRELSKNNRWYNRRFYDDLKRYPKALQQSEKEKAKFAQKCIQLYKKGVEDGLFQSGINFEIISQVIQEQSKMIRPSKIFSQLSIQEVYNTLLLIFLRGVCTEKGLATLNKYTAKQSYKNSLD